jgi:tetratricopeptide (TPR) repeat protein
MKNASISLEPTSADINSLIALYKAGHYPEMESQLRLLVDRFPNFGLGYKLLGSALQIQGKNALPALKMAANLLPGEADSHFNLGVAQNMFGLIDEAAASYRRALQIKPDYAEAHRNLGNVLADLRLLDDAAASYRRALQFDFDDAETYRNLGNVLIDLGLLDEAVASHRRAVALKSDDALANFDMGNALTEAGHFEEAAASYRRALQIKPDFAEAHNKLGVSLKALGQFDNAQASYRHALKLNPMLAESHNNLGKLLDELGQTDAAVTSFRRAIELKPDFAEAHSNLGDILQALGQHDDARASKRRALQLNYNSAELHTKLGVTLLERGQIDSAVANFRRATLLNPDYVRAHINLGSALLKRQQFGEAEDCFCRALQLNKESATAKLNLSFALLSQCRYAEAWPKYEARYDPSISGRLSIPPNLPFPQWRGEHLAGKSIVVWPEQGFGDEIQFARFVPMLKDVGASRITLVCKPPLKRLMETLEGVDTVVARSEAASLPNHDYWTFPMSLPLYFGTTIETIPAKLPYLNVPSKQLNQWHERLPLGNVKVGLAWKGNPEHSNDSNRSLPSISTLAPLWTVPGVTFISLQKGPGEDEAVTPPVDQPILHLGSEIRDFADTSAIVAQLDLVICIDTAIAHLAGALNTPCWVLLPVIGIDWRWLPEGKDSPWYPGVMRLFRQTKSDDWSATIGEVAQALNTLVKERGISGIDHV